MGHRLDSLKDTVDAELCNHGTVMKEMHVDLEKMIAEVTPKMMFELERVQQMMFEKEKSILGGMANDLKEETAARRLLAIDCTALSDHIKDVKIALGEDFTTLRGIILKLQSKTHDQITELKELITVENSSRERASVADRSACTQRVSEL